MSFLLLVLFEASLLAISPESVTDTSLAIFYVGEKNAPLYKPLDIPARQLVMLSGIASQGKAMGFASVVKELDAIALRNGENFREIVVTLISDSNWQGHRYELPRGELRKQWIDIIGMLASRYGSGTFPFGCNLLLAAFQRDCFSGGDGLFPSPEVKKVLLSKPVRYWQIENEWLWQIVPSKGYPICDQGIGNGKVACPPELVSNFEELRFVIWLRAPFAKFIAGAMTGVDAAVYFDGGHLTEPFLDSGDDCTYRSDTPPREHPSGVYFAERVKTLLARTDLMTDAIDYHYYGNRIQNIPAHVSWFRSQLGKRKPVWSTEMTMPFWFHTEKGEPNAPADACTTQNWTDFMGPLYSEPYYDLRRHASALVELVSTALAGGVARIYYACGDVPSGWNQQYTRLALIDKRYSPLPYVDGVKPAFDTFRRLREYLKGVRSARMVSRGLVEFERPKASPAYIVWDGTAIYTKDPKARYDVVELVTTSGVEPRTWKGYLADQISILLTDETHGAPLWITRSQ